MHINIFFDYGVVTPKITLDLPGKGGIINFHFIYWSPVKIIITPMRKLIPFFLSLSPFVMQAQNSKPNDALINEQFDKKILGDQLRKVEKVNAFPPTAVVFQCSNSIPAYNPKMDLGDRVLKSFLENPGYSEASKIQFIKDALADTTRVAVESFTYDPCTFWRSSKEATALVNAWFDARQFEKSEESFIRYRRLKFVTRSQLPESYQMITDYFKSRPTLTIKYDYEADLVYWLVQMGKEKEALDYLEVIVEDLIHGRVQYPSFGSRSGVFERGNLFDFLCLSENETVAKRANDLLFHLLDHKTYEPHVLYPLSSRLDKARHNQMLDKWYAYYSSLDFNKVDPKELQTKGWQAVRETVPECDNYESFMSGNWRYLLGKYGAGYWKELFSKSVYTQKKSRRHFEEIQFELLTILFRNFPYSDRELQQMLFDIIKTENLVEYKEQYLLLISMAWPDRKVSKTDFDKLQLGKFLAYTSPLDIKPYKKNVIKAPVFTMPEEKINELVTDLNSMAVKCKLPAITLNKLTKFLIGLKNPYGVIHDYLRINNVVIGFYREDSDVPTDYVKLFEEKFAHVVSRQHCSHFTIAQETKAISKNEYNYHLFVKYKNSSYKIEYTEKGTHEYTDMQRLVKMLNRCLIDNKEKKRFIGMYSDAFSEFLLIEPAAIMPLSKKYDLALFAIDEDNGAQDPGDR
jgi:hypothetical protein